MDSEVELMKDAITALKQGEKKLAYSKFRQVLSINQNNDKAWMYLAYIISDPNKALAYIDKSLKINPLNDKAWDLKKKIESKLQNKTSLASAPPSKQNRRFQKSDEQIILNSKIPFKVFHFSHGFLWLLLFGWNFGLLYSWLQSLSWHVKLTSQRIVLIKGLISQHEEEVEFYRVSDSGFSQGICQRVFGIGIVTIFSDDTTSTYLRFPTVEPKKYRELIRGFIRQQRKEMRAIQID